MTDAQKLIIERGRRNRIMADAQAGFGLIFWVSGLAIVCISCGWFIIAKTLIFFATIYAALSIRELDKAEKDAAGPRI